MFDHPKTFLPRQFSIAGLLDSIGSMPGMIDISQHIAEHFTIGIAPHRSLLEIEAVEIGFIKGSDHVLSLFFGDTLPDDHILTLGRELLLQFLERHFQKRRRHGSYRRRIMDVGSIGIDHLHGNIHRKLLTIPVENASTAGRDHLTGVILLSGYC